MTASVGMVQLKNKTSRGLILHLRESVWFGDMIVAQLVSIAMAALLKTH
jgi:hypothetical protein